MEGLFALLKATKKEFDKKGLVATMAYYPDSRQEKLLAAGGRAAAARPLVDST